MLPPLPECVRHLMANRGLLDVDGYRRLLRATARFVLALDRYCEPADAVYVPKARGELEPLLALFPFVMLAPVRTISPRTLLRMRAYPIHPVGVMSATAWADGRWCNPGEFYFHDIDHARFKVREDLLALGFDIPDAYRDGSTVDPVTGQHRTIIASVLAVAGDNLWIGAADRLRLIDRLLHAADCVADRTLAKSAELLLFEILHEKSLPLGSLASEVPDTGHRDKLRRKAAAGFFGPEPPPGAVIERLDDAAAWLLARL